MNRIPLLLVLIIPVTPALQTPAAAQDQDYACCEQCGNDCGNCNLVQCTVMVRALVLETRMKTHVVKDCVEREETYTVFRKVPVTRKFYTEICYLEDQVKTKTITQKRCRLVQVPVERTYSVKVYHPEIRDIPVPNPCDRCGKHKGDCRTQRCEVMIEHTEKRSEVFNEFQVVIEKTTKEISYRVKVPKKRKTLCSEETTYKLVPVEKTRMVRVCVPRIVKTPVEVTVCKMVPKTIVCCPSCAARHR